LSETEQAMLMPMQRDPERASPLGHPHTALESCRAGGSRERTYYNHRSLEIFQLSLQEDRTPERHVDECAVERSARSSTSLKFLGTISSEEFENHEQTSRIALLILGIYFLGQNIFATHSSSLLLRDVPALQFQAIMALRLLFFLQRPAIWAGFYWVLVPFWSFEWRRYFKTNKPVELLHCLCCWLGFQR